jgi:hypothetical protein
MHRPLRSFHSHGQTRVPQAFRPRSVGTTARPLLVVTVLGRGGDIGFCLGIQRTVLPGAAGAAGEVLTVTGLLVG